MTSAIQHFYKDKTIFLTGGSGFFGKVIIEKLLRTTDVKRIFVLIRPKKGQDMQQRIAGWQDEPIFALLLKSDPDALQRIAPISGDCQNPDLGISQADRALLSEKVQVVLHGAATVRFTEPLHLALDINTRATRSMLQLARQMQRLEAFVHVSTAFSNCVIEYIDERYYPEHLTCSADKVLALREQLSDELIDTMAPALLGKYPNTYTYTKALAEQILQFEAGDLPVCIYRPGVILGTYKEPVEGWIDNLYGPIAILYGAAYGVLRTVQLNVKYHANIVPVDFCTNILLACAWQTAREAAKPIDVPINRCLNGQRDQLLDSPPKRTPDVHLDGRHDKSLDSSLNETLEKPLDKSLDVPPERSHSPLIYNYVPSAQNMLTWGGFKIYSLDLSDVYPLEHMMWVPFLHTTSTLWLFQLIAFFYHTLPGYLIDTILRLRGKKPRMTRLYTKIHRNIKLLAPFGNTNWSFRTENTQRLWRCLSQRDQQIYQFDMASLDWRDYFYRSIGGMRIYLGKEEPSKESIQRGQRKRARFVVLHHLLQLVVCSGAAAMLWSCLKLVLSF
ncbi:hypothetical protein KR222_011011 [Zaprionus bogoriensis]|nr:hypothetical protein KR222_011011 [Zaprionus bogoriensis]